MCEERTRQIDESVIFECRCCSACCTAPWRVIVQAENIGRIKDHDWSKYPKLQGKTLFYPSADGQPDHYDLAKDQDGGCLFLDSDGLCVVHKELGEEAKPFMCLQFPFLATRNGTDERISVNYGCPAVQRREGIPLIHYREKLQAKTLISAAPRNPDAPWLLDSNTPITPAQADAFFDRAIRIFGDDRDENIWNRFAELLTVLGAMREMKTQTPGNEQNLIDFLNSDELRPGGCELPQVIAWESPSLAPMAVRLLFATTLFADTLSKDTKISDGFLGRLRRVPKLMALAQLSGQYNSLFLGRPINIADLMNQDIDFRISESGRQLLLRYYRSRFWQRFQRGTGLTIVSGIHQRIHDLNAILFFARAAALDRGQTTLDVEAVEQALKIVEFHFANQPRLHAHTLKGILRSALDSLPLAASSLRLMAPKQPEPVLEAVGV